MSQQSRTDGCPVTPKDHIVGLFQKKNGHAHWLIGDMTGEDTTKILTRLSSWSSASAVLTQMRNLCAGDNNDSHITDEVFLLLQEENKSLKRQLEDLESHYDTRLPVVADEQWHLQIRHYAANTLFTSLEFIHSKLQLDDLLDPFSIENTCAKHFKTDRRSVVTFWMTYSNDLVVGIKRKKCNVQESVSKDFKGWLAILMWLHWAYYDKLITLSWHGPNNEPIEMIKNLVFPMSFVWFAKARTYPLSNYPTIEEHQT
jgi:hypothetical protein